MIFRLCRFLLHSTIDRKQKYAFAVLKLYFKYQTESKIRTPFCLPKKKTLYISSYSNEADMHK